MMENWGELAIRALPGVYAASVSPDLTVIHLTPDANADYVRHAAGAILNGLELGSGALIVMGGTVAPRAITSHRAPVFASMAAGVAVVGLAGAAAAMGAGWLGSGFGRGKSTPPPAATLAGPPAGGRNPSPASGGTPLPGPVVAPAPASVVPPPVGPGPSAGGPPAGAPSGGLALTAPASPIPGPVSAPVVTPVVAPLLEAPVPGAPGPGAPGVSPTPPALFVPSAPRLTLPSGPSPEPQLVGVASPKPAGDSDHERHDQEHRKGTPGDGDHDRDDRDGGHPPHDTPVAAGHQVTSPGQHAVAPGRLG